MLIVLQGCGRRSEIKNAVESQATAEVHGDGNLTILPLVLPLSDQEIASFDSPLGKVGFVAGGITKMLMNLGASMGLGKTRLSLTQQIPKLPDEYIKSIKVKRIFFYIEPVKNHQRRMSWYQRWIMGRDDINFEFIDRMAVKLSTHHLENVNSWLPIVESAEISRKEFTSLETEFEKDDSKTKKVNLENQDEIILFKYDWEESERYIKAEGIQNVQILNTSSPLKTRKFLSEHPDLKGHLNRIKLLNKTVLVELKDDADSIEAFKNLTSKEKNKIKELGVDHIEACSPKTCLDFNLPDVNLLPLLLKNNGIRLDAFLDAYEVPDSFQLKGFIEFELKLKLTF